MALDRCLPRRRALQLEPQTFGTAQLVTQFFNLLFYCVWLLCLSRMTRWKMAGLAAGFLVIGVFFAAWGRGHGNVNEAPSILALRYLPTLLMVAAISHLRPPHRHSLFTVASAFLSGLWSIETLISTVAVHCVFLGFAGLRDRALVRLLADGLAALLPAMAAVVSFALDQVATGHWPDYGLYLQYLLFLRSDGSILGRYPADPLFFGWFAMLLAAFVVFSDAWARVFSATCYVTATSNEMLFYRYVPMAALLLMQGAYYVARSVDYTLVMAFFSVLRACYSGSDLGRCRIVGRQMAGQGSDRRSGHRGDVGYDVHVSLGAARRFTLFAVRTRMPGSWTLHSGVSDPRSGRDASRAFGSGKGEAARG